MGFGPYIQRKEIPVLDTFQLNNLKLGDFTINNVVVSVAHDPGNNDNLMGLGFCKKFSDVQWSLINEKILFIK